MHSRQTHTGAAIAVAMAVAVSAVAVAVTGTGAAPAGAVTPPIQFGVGGLNMVRDNPDPSERMAAYRNLRELGVKWIRTDISWDKVELEPGVYAWGRLDRLFTEAKAAGFKILAIIHRTADYARPNNQPEWYPPTSTTALAAWSRFARTLALRYTRPSNVRISAVEVWNEPNNPLTWAGPVSMTKYVNLLRRVFNEFNRVNPATTVITGGLAPAPDTATSVNPRTFVTRLYANGAKPYFDAIGMHPYTFPALASAGLRTGWGNMTLSDQGRPSMRATMVARGDGAKKIWSTEFGSPAANVGEARQATIARDGVTTWRRYSWAGPFIYMSYKDQELLPGWHKSMGLLREDNTRRPAFGAYKSAIRAGA